ELVAPEQMPGNAQPPSEVFFAVRGGDQRQDRMIIAGAQDVKNLLILELPKQVAAFDDAIDPLLEFRVGQSFQQRARERKMDPGDLLEFPKRAGDAIQSQKDFARLPFMIAQQRIQVSGRLMQV